MTFRVILFDGRKEAAPQWWRNYVDSHNIPMMTNMERDLKNYTAKFIYDEETSNRYLEFEDESYYSMLVLRYS